MDSLADNRQVVDKTTTDNRQDKTRHCGAQCLEMHCTISRFRPFTSATVMRCCVPDDHLSSVTYLPLY